MKVMPSDQPQSLHSWPIFSVGDCLAPRTTQLLGAYAGWVAACGWGQAYKSCPVVPQPWAFAPIGLSLLSQAVWLTDGHPSSGRSKEVRGPRCVGQQHPSPLLREVTAHTRAGPPPASRTSPLGKGGIARTSDSRSRQLSWSSQLHKKDWGAEGLGAEEVKTVFLRFLDACLSRKSSTASGCGGRTWHL